MCDVRGCSTCNGFGDLIISVWQAHSVLCPLTVFIPLLGCESSILLLNHMKLVAIMNPLTEFDTAVIFGALFILPSSSL
jgi:hypothetical protein